MLTLDAGDLFFNQEIKADRQKIAQLKARLICRIYNQIGCDALNIGENDLAMGLEFLKNLEKTASFPFISANLTDKNNKLLFKPYIVKSIGGIKVGVFGVIGDDSEIRSQIEKSTQGTIVVQGMLAAAQVAVEKLKQQVDIIVAMTHQKVGRDWVLARRVNGIDIIIGGHGGYKLPKPYKAGSTLIMRAGDEGQYLGHVSCSLSLDGAKEFKSILVPLNDKITSDKEVIGLMKAYQQSLASLYNFKPISQIALHELKCASCADCHQEIFESWKTTKHAKAYTTLVMVNRNNDTECLSCHTTRFDKLGGFLKSVEREKLIHVQCGSCHGNGAEHTNSEGEKQLSAVTKDSCLTCHRPERSSKFLENYDEYLNNVRH